MRRDHPPAGRMAAFLRKLLVLELDRRRASRLIAAHRMSNVEQAPIARISVSDERRCRHRANTLDSSEHVRIRRKTGVGKAQMRSDRAVARHIESRETHRIGNLGRYQIKHAGCDDERSGCKTGA